jgi:hypothetical protein
MTPKQNRETAQALLQVLGDKAPPELREALAAPSTPAVPWAATVTRQPARAQRPRHHHRFARPRSPCPRESTAPLAWFAALLVGGACLLSILGSCDAQHTGRAVTQTWGHRR